ncbi:MAG: DUF6531 domain-containing protein, partial [Acidobacteria bacterium]|nr:DUF6531 domain-containing protein [Acidobacteriota bacterium]
ETDGVVVCPGPDLEFSRYYNSHLDYEGPLGPHWTHTYDWKLSWTNCEYRGVTSSWARLRTGTGDQLWFGQTGTGSTWRAVGRNATLAPTGTMYRVVVDDSSFYLFDGTDGTLQTISDRTGRQIALAYEDGLLSTATHDNGWQLIFGYDENGRLGEVESAEMHDFCVVFFYNAGGELSDALQLPADAPDPGYYWLTYSYGDHHELTGRVNAAGDTFTYTYEIITNAEQVVVAKGRSSTVGTDLLRTAVGFDTASDVSTVTYDRGDVTQTLVYAYSDENLMVRAITNVSAGTVTARTTTGARDATSERETDLATGAFVESAVGYDEQHRTWSTSFGLNAGPQNPWFTRWNEDGLLQALIDPEDNYPSKPDRTTFEYLNGLPIAVHSWYTSSNSFSTGFRYENGLLCDVTNANGHVLTMEYEAAGDRPSLVTPPAGPATAYRYSWYDESPMKVFVGVGGRTNTLYRDGWYRVYRIDYPDGLSEAVGYDGAGNPTNLTDRAGHQTRWTYAPTGKLQLMVSDAEGIAATNRFDYDRQFNTLAIVDANGRGVESYQLDLQDRPVSVTNVQGQVMSVTYLIGDYVSRLLRFDGSQVSNAYDGDGNLAAAFFADTTNRYGWRADGLLKTAGDGRSAATNGYDNVNRLAGQTNFYSPYLSTVAFQTDPVGNVTGEFWKVLSGGAAIRSETNLYRYDVGERLTNQVANGASYAYSYDSSNGLPDLVQYPNGLKVSYSYDLVDRLTGVVWSNGAGQVASFRYVFDHGDMVSNRTAIIAGTTNVYRYIYDGLDRLTWVSAGGSNSLFTYDKAGNRINTDVDWG